MHQSFGISHKASLPGLKPLGESVKFIAIGINFVVDVPLKGVLDTCVERDAALLPVNWAKPATVDEPCRDVGMPTRG